MPPMLSAARGSHGGSLGLQGRPDKKRSCSGRRGQSRHLVGVVEGRAATRLLAGEPEPRLVRQEPRFAICHLRRRCGLNFAVLFTEPLVVTLHDSTPPETLGAAH